MQYSTAVQVMQYSNSLIASICFCINVFPAQETDSHTIMSLINMHLQVSCSACLTILTQLIINMNASHKYNLTRDIFLIEMTKTLN